jgi:hypothetical protein
MDGLLELESNPPHPTRVADWLLRPNPCETRALFLPGASLNAACTAGMLAALETQNLMGAFDYIVRQPGPSVRRTLLEKERFKGQPDTGPRCRTSWAADGFSLCPASSMGARS